MELLVPQVLEQVLVVELDADRALGSAVDDARHLAQAAQAAARTRSLRFALLRADFEFHACSLMRVAWLDRTRDQVPVGWKTAPIL